MATHHVSLRRFCPNPLDIDSIIGRVLPQHEPDSNGARLSKMRYCFYPWGPLTTERLNSIRIGKGHVSSHPFLHRLAEMVMKGGPSPPTADYC
jgi:hypothetical protein